MMSNNVMPGYKRFFIQCIVFFIALKVVFFACSTIEESIVKSGKMKEEEQIRNTVIQQAYALLDKRPDEDLSINGKTFKLDCTGTIKAIFYAANIDLDKDFNQYTGNGVKRIYHSLKDKDGIYDKKIPEIGDIIFWDNTWDKNGDNKFGNDPLTHAGIVVGVDDDGTIHYIHQNYVLGITIERMNLRYPEKHKDHNGKVINSAMYINSSMKKHPEHWLAGDLYKKFGGVLSKREHYENK